MKKILLMLLLIGSIVCSQWSIARAEVPHLINYQGRLTDTNGAPLNGSYNITLRIYDAETAGNLLWEETQTGIVIQKGIFSILLGSVRNLDLAFDKPYFLEIVVNNEVMSPRQPITSVAYAITAENAVPRGVIVMWSGLIADIPPGWQLCNGANGTPDLRDKFIVGARIDDGGESKTIVSGVLTKVGGASIHHHTGPSHIHSFSVNSDTESANTPVRNDYANVQVALGAHRHSISGTTGAGGTGITGDASSLNPYYALAFIMKL